MVLAIVCATVSLCGPELSAQESTHVRTRESSRELPLPPRTSAASANQTHRPKSASSANSLVSTAISLGLIVGVLLLVGKGMKTLGFRGPPALPTDAFELLARKTIEPKVTIHLVKCGSRVLILGVGPDGVRTLSEIDDPAEVVRLTEACQGSRKDDSESTRRSDPTTATVPLKTPGTSRRVIQAMAAVGLSLTMGVSAEAQPSRGNGAAARSREQGPTAPAAANPRQKEVQLAAHERDLPTEADPRQLGSPAQIGLSLKMLMLMTVFSLAPSILMMTTCFVRFAVALGLLRQALGTQQGLPNQVLTAICMFLTFMVMSPIWQRSYEEGIRPYTSPAPGESSLDEAAALAKAVAPIRTFMGQQIEKANNADAVWMLLDFQRPAPDSPSAGSWHEPQSYEEVPITVLAPAYLLSELKVGFLIGFQLFLPFLAIDLVVAMVLTSLGLTMMPPAMVSLPFKLLLFVLIDGWFLTVGMLLESVRVT